MRRSTAIAVTSAVLLIGASTAVAAPRTGVVLACVNTSNGNVRITADACRTSETPLSWNQTGPEGPQGAQGPAGPTGPQGPRGPAGPPPALGAGSVSGEATGSADGATGNLRLGTVTGNGDNLPGADGNLADATVGRHNLVNGAVGTGALADGAVTSAEGVFIVGSDILSAGQVTVRLFNATATNVPTQPDVSFTIRWVDLTS